MDSLMEILSVYVFALVLALLCAPIVLAVWALVVWWPARRSAQVRSRSAHSAVAPEPLRLQGMQSGPPVDLSEAERERMWEDLPKAAKRFID